ncbi:TonB-dependent receptor [Gramella sp. BOM4]|nr:TonB-dependent receptor [Christiangramia bathymodioli]
MQRLLFLFIFCMSLQSLSAQDSIQKLTINFNDVPLREALQQIEERSGLEIFYAEQWIPETLISKTFEETPLNEILDELFSETILNYYIFNGENIILTSNSRIYDKLPEGFFGRDPQENIDQDLVQDEPSAAPVFYNNSQDPNQEIETVRIGKEGAQPNRRTYQLSGYVLDKATGEPITNLAVILENTGTGVSTNINGYYEIKLRAGENLIRTSSITNENVTKRVIIYSDGTLNLNLTESLESLGEVQISSNANKNVENANTGEEEIDIENIKNVPLVLGERDILKVAMTLPGITTAGEGSAGYNVRGGKADQNLILLDDAVMYNPAHFFGLFSAINPFTTGSATIYKGNIPAEYGGRLSSVFDLRTKDSNTREFQGEASIGPVTSNLTVELPIIKEKSGLMLGGRSTYSNWILRSLDEPQLKNSTAFFYDGIAKYNHEFNENNKLTATAYVSDDRFSITSDSVYNYQNRLLTLHYNHRFNDRNRGALILTNSDYKFNIDYDNSLQDSFRSGYHINETEVKLDMKHVLNSAHQFDYGVSTKLYQIDPGFIEPLDSESSINDFSLSEEQGLESAIWLADNYEVNEKLSLSAGLRYSIFTSLGAEQIRYYDPASPKNDNSVIGTEEFESNEPIKTYSGPELRLSARYFLLPDLSVKGSYNNTYQYIHTLSNNVTVSPTDTYRLSGYHIEPQGARQFSLGFFKNWMENTVETSIEGYYKTSDNLLDFKTGANLFLNEFVETEVIQGEGKSYGAELLIKKKAGDFNGWLSYTYSRSFLKLDGEFDEETVNDGEFFPSNYDKPHDFSLVTNYKLTQRFSFSANFVYQTGRPITYPTGKFDYGGSEYVLYSDRNQFRIPDYYRLDLSVNLEGNHKLEKLGHTFWNFSVYNVLGRNNPYSVFFVTQDGEVEGKQASIFSVPVPTISFNFQF